MQSTIKYFAPKSAKKVLTTLKTCTEVCSIFLHFLVQKFYCWFRFSCALCLRGDLVITWVALIC